MSKFVLKLPKITLTTVCVSWTHTEKIIKTHTIRDAFTEDKFKIINHYCII